MKIFQTVQKSFAVLGIISNSNQSRLNKKLIKVCMICYLSGTLATAFLILEAKGFWQYTMNIYVTTSTIMISSYFTFWIFKVEEFYALITNVEEVFNKSLFFIHLFTLYNIK